MTIQLYCGDCLEILPTLPGASVDCIIADPPYPEIDREYGRMSEADWMVMMKAVVRETRRILKPTGSAVFILQPNSEKVGKMRLWLWRFMVWAGEYWNIVQDAYWWNYAAMPTGGSTRLGLMRPSVKSCIWIGNSPCYRNQDAALWTESDNSKYRRIVRRASPEVYNNRRVTPSGHSSNLYTVSLAAERRGGVTPYNLFPTENNGPLCSGSTNGHGAGTPLKLCDWWTRYICPPGGVVLDMFAGSGTTGIAAAQNGCSYIGIEKFPKYWPILRERVETAYATPRQAEMVMPV